MTSAEALSELTEHGERALNGFLRRESGEQFTTADLARAARNWPAAHQYLQLPERRLRASVVAARRQHEASILDVAIAKIGAFEQGLLAHFSNTQGALVAKIDQTGDWNDEIEAAFKKGIEEFKATGTW